MQNSIKPREARKGQGDRSLPPPVADEGRRSVGNRKERRLCCDYASFPDSGPWWGLRDWSRARPVGETARRNVWKRKGALARLFRFQDGRPNVPPTRSDQRKRSQGAKRDLTVASAHTRPEAPAPAVPSSSALPVPPDGLAGTAQIPSASSMHVPKTLRKRT